MRTKIEAGAVVDAATPDEVALVVREAIGTQVRELTNGITYSTVRASTVHLDADAGRPLQAGFDTVGPRPGRVWAIRRISAYGGQLDIHTDDDQPSTYVDTVTPGRARLYGPGQFILRAGSTLYVKNTSVSPVRVTLNLAIADVPVSHEWRI